MLFQSLVLIGFLSLFKLVTNYEERRGNKCLITNFNWKTSVKGSKKADSASVIKLLIRIVQTIGFSLWVILRLSYVHIFFILVVNVALRTEPFLRPRCTHFRNEKMKIFGICGL